MFSMGGQVSTQMIKQTVLIMGGQVSASND
jgi:hypothetical protein